MDYGPRQEYDSTICISFKQSSASSSQPKKNKKQNPNNPYVLWDKKKK